MVSSETRRMSRAVCLFLLFIFMDLEGCDIIFEGCLERFAWFHPKIEGCLERFAFSYFLYLWNWRDVILIFDRFLGDFF